jgi:hypothetical protein
METIKLYEFVDSVRPYMDIETKLLNQIRVGMFKLIKEAEASDEGFSALIRITKYQGQIMAIDHEIAMRN